MEQTLPVVHCIYTEAEKSLAELLEAAVGGADDLLAHHVERHPVGGDGEGAGEVEPAEDQPAVGP